MSPSRGQPNDRSRHYEATAGPAGAGDVVDLEELGRPDRRPRQASAGTQDTAALPRLLAVSLADEATRRAVT
ncbi:hypothetical protein UK82_29520 [Frankia sp. ACN1ag]|nr:hypothetical protein UK82_29520 [Frankia sp. ACN1ag]